MTFLQPFILFGLPLLLVPVLVHLLNRLRYRTVAWPTLMFLLAASKQATRQARVREWLILACRLLAVLALLLFLARPLVGGWLGWAAGSRPDTVLVLLDRSPSMETADAQTHLSKRALALRRLAETGGGVGGGTRYVLLDSATRQPQEFASPAVLKDLAVAGPSDTAADIPALLDAGLDYLQANPAGRAEIWLCSDLQQSNWRPRTPGWDTVRARFARQATPVPVRLLALTGGAQDNLAVRVTDVTRRRTGKGSELELTVEVTGQAATATLPLTIVHEGARSQVAVNFGGQKLTTQCRLDLGPRRSAGWGWVELPPDANPRDNQAFFVYPEDRCATALVVAESEPAGRCLRRAAAPAPELLNQAAAVQRADADLKLDDVALLLWQAAPPSDAAEKAVAAFVADGGVALYLPPAAAATAGAFRVTTWRGTDGPLARTQDGKDLPLPEVAFAKRAALAGDGAVLALFDDGQPFLTKQTLGRGAIYRLASLPVPDWSSLGEGRVLVPLVQRLLQQGARRLGQVADADVGDPRFRRAERLAPAEPDGAVAAKAATAAFAAGVYRQEAKLLALNRPAAEDEPERLDDAGVRETLGAIPYRLFAETGTAAAAAPTEIWRWFVLAMLLFLTGEAIFTLPTAAPTRWTVPGARRAFGPETPAAGGPS